MPSQKFGPRQEMPERAIAPSDHLDRANAHTEGASKALIDGSVPRAVGQLIAAMEDMHAAQLMIERRMTNAE